MFKIFNTKGILMVAGVLVVIHLAAGLIISPILAGAVIKAMNKVSGTKISAKKINVWPLTLSLTAGDVKIFDPEDETKCMVAVKRSGARLSIMGLLSKRIVFSNITVSGAKIDLEGESDGSFNLQKLAPSSESASSEEKSFFSKFKGKQDWFGKIFKMLRDSSSEKASEKKKEEVIAARKVEKEVFPAR